MYVLTMEDLWQIAIDQSANPKKLTPEKMREIYKGVTSYISEYLPEGVAACLNTEDYHTEAG